MIGCIGAVFRFEADLCKNKLDRKTSKAAGLNALKTINMNEKILVALITGFFGLATTVIGGVFAILASRKKSNESTTKTQRPEHNAAIQSPKTLPPPSSEMLLTDLAEIMPITVVRPSDVPLGSIMSGVGGFLIGTGILLLFTEFAKAGFIAFAILAFYCFLVGAFLVRLGTRNHILHLNIGRRNGDIIFKIQERLLAEKNFDKLFFTDEKLDREGIPFKRS